MAERTIEKINTAFKSISKGADIKEEMTLVLGPHHNWEEYLILAPVCIGILGELMAVSTVKDFSLSEHSQQTEWKYMRWPDSFRASLMQVVNKGHAAFNEAHKGMDRIRLESQSVPESVLTAVDTIVRGTAQDLKYLLPGQLNDIKETADTCVKIANKVEKEFEFVTCLIAEIIESSTAARGSVEMKMVDMEIAKSVQEQQKKITEKQEEMAKQSVEELKNSVDKAEETFYTVMDGMPSGLKLIGLKTLEGLSNTVTGALSGIIQGALSHYNAPMTFISVVGKALDVGRQIIQKPTDPGFSTSHAPVTLDPDTIKAYAQVSQLKTSAESLKIECIANNKMNTTIDEKNVKFVIKTFEVMLKDAKVKGENKIRDRVMDLCRNGRSLCEDVLKIMLSSEVNTNCPRIADSIIAFHDEVLKVDVEANAMLCASPTPMKAPNELVLPPPMQPDANVVQQVVENARFKVEQARTHLQHTRQLYAQNCAQLKEETAKLGEILAEMKKLDLKTEDFNQIRDTLFKGMNAMGSLRKQWAKLVMFFQMMANLIECSLDKPLKKFHRVADSTPQRSLVEGYDARSLYRDQMYKHAFETAKIAYLVNMISNCYVEVSQRFIMQKIAGLGKLMGFNPTTEMAKILHERNILDDELQEAQEGIYELVVKRKIEFDHKITERIGKIETSLQAALPPASDSDKKKIKQITEKGMDNFRTVDPARTSKLNLDELV